MNAALLADILRATVERHGGEDWNIDGDEFWLRATPDDYHFQRQGWKLHVSATPLSAPVVLAQCAAVLAAGRCAFKCARDLACVRTLLDGRCPRGSSGKFITGYPADDEQFRRMAAELDTATQDLRGPRILSDRPLRPGSLVHYRYGVCQAQPVLTNDGCYEPMLTGPDGATVVDQRMAWFTPPPWARFPFPGDDEPTATENATAGDGLRLADRFVVRRAIVHASKGGVYVATDTHDGTDVVVKQARRHVGAYFDGTDCRDDLRHEAAMLGHAALSGICPRRVALVEQQGDLFLAEELIPGVRLWKWVATRTRRGGDAGLGEAGYLPAAIRLAQGVTSIVAAAHDAGLVLRDLNPNNLIVTPDERPRLIDLECVVRPGERVLRRWTMGFAAPEQVTAPYFGPAPGLPADLFSLGATLFYLVTGVPPVFQADLPDGRDLAARLDELISAMAGNLELAAFAPLIRGLMAQAPDERWPLARVRDFLRDLTAQAPAHAPSPTVTPRGGRRDLGTLVRDGLAHVARTMTPGEPRLWESGNFERTTDPCNVQHGAAGVLAVLLHADAVEDHPGLRDTLAATATWIDERLNAVPRVLPGLYFGRSGTAWALHDAATRLDDPAMAARALALAERVPAQGWGNPDVAHGLAGAGLAQLHLWRATGRDDFRERALRCAGAVLAAARRRGTQTMWPVPAGFDSMLAGIEHYGFAHGVAGAGAFLLYAAVASEQDRFLAAALAAGDTLAEAAAHEAAAHDGEAARWPSSPRDQGDRDIQHWCSGASGVGTFLIRLWHVTGDDRFLALADGAAVTVRRQRWWVNNSGCHGLAGDGEFLLDMAAFTGDRKYLDWAGELAAVIVARRFYLDGLAVVWGDDPHAVTSDFNTGLSGIIEFGLRLRHGGQRLWLPDELLADELLPGRPGDRP